MSRVIYLPTSENPPTRALPQVPGVTVRKCRSTDADARLLAHELKNCMSTLLLGFATLERDGDQWKISARSRGVFEDVVLDMNRIVDALIDSTPYATVSDQPDRRHQAGPPRGAAN